VLDLSQSRVWLRLSGPSAAGFLNHHLPLDLRDSQFTQRRVACSAIHHVGVTLWRDLASFNLLIPRSFAVSIFQLLTDSACQYGVEIQSRDWTGKA
jgi:heterotetrameric sarcosine oxidase gamma subunit